MKLCIGRKIKKHPKTKQSEAKQNKKAPGSLLNSLITEIVKSRIEKKVGEGGGGWKSRGFVLNACFVFLIALKKCSNKRFTDLIFVKEVDTFGVMLKNILHASLGSSYSCNMERCSVIVIPDTKNKIYTLLYFGLD